jgi:hypothetical protein
VQAIVPDDGLSFVEEKDDVDDSKTYHFLLNLVLLCVLSVAGLHALLSMRPQHTSETFSPISARYSSPFVPLYL